MDYYRLTIPIPKQPWKWIWSHLATILLLAAIVAISSAWLRDHRQLALEFRKFRNPAPPYAAEQALGPPDSVRQGDSSYAWCPNTKDGGKEWLLLEFSQPIAPTTVVVYENYMPGAVVRVTHCPAVGMEQTLWEGTYVPFSGPAGNEARLPISTRLVTDRIKVYLDTAVSMGWNEIDAVGILTGNNQVVWASRATASSTWNQSSASAVSALFSTPTH
jgi:hypothetical protein